MQVSAHVESYFNSFRNNESKKRKENKNVRVLIFLRKLVCSSKEGTVFKSRFKHYSVKVMRF